MVKMDLRHNGTFFILENGVEIPRSFTPQTSSLQVAEFWRLLELHEAEAAELTKEYKEKLEWNHTHRGQGKNWPIFGKMEKFLNKLQKEAGIEDS